METDTILNDTASPRTDWPAPLVPLSPPPLHGGRATANGGDELDGEFENDDDDEQQRPGSGAASASNDVGLLLHHNELQLLQAATSSSNSFTDESTASKREYGCVSR